jgi:phospholipase/carboxylesterase
MRTGTTLTDAERDARRGRLRLHPSTHVTGLAAAGRRGIEVDGTFAGVCYVPSTIPRRLVLLLHGADGTAEAALRLLLPYADDRGLALYAPKSNGPTWDVGRCDGVDVRRIQDALTQVLSTLPMAVVPPAIGGFSDGASYALSLALSNGDVFDTVLAFSPGFAAPTQKIGRPAVFISHGRDDRVLPIGRCGGRLARVLCATGYPVDYHEFNGGHEVPQEVVMAALDWLVHAEPHR